MKARYTCLMTAAAIFFLAACTMTVKTHLGEKTVAGERIALKTVEQEQVWSTADLTLRYTVSDAQETFTLSGHVEISTSVTYTFPAAEYLIIYVYLLNEEGVATSRHGIRPAISVYNTFPDSARFKATLPKDEGTTSIAFGYLGNFISSERETIGGRVRYEKLEWEIYHVPFD